MNEDWKPGVIHMGHRAGRVEVNAGWLCGGLGLFGLDGFEDEPTVWSLTHLATGLRVVILIGSRAHVMGIASEIVALADWSFASLDGWRDRHPDLPGRIHDIAQRDPGSFGSYPKAEQRFHDDRPEDQTKIEVARLVAEARGGQVPA